MGTSLSGLTPATTFDGLLKTSDNEPLDGTLKAISTGDGTDTILQLSNSALSIGGDVSITGTTSDNTASALSLTKANGNTWFDATNDGQLTLGSVGSAGRLNLNRSSGGSLYGRISAEGTGLLIQGAGTALMYIGRNSSEGITLHNGLTHLNAALGIKGSGATSATTSLLVQNSAGTELLKVQDDGIIDSQYLRINGSSFSPTISVEGNLGKALRLGNEGFFSSFNYLDLKTWDGSAFSPAMRITGNTSQFVGIGETTPTARLHIKGSGNDNTTTSLLVQNSDGADKFKINDAGGTEVTTNETWKLTLQSNDLSQFLKFSSNNIYTTGPLYLSGSTTTLQGNGVPRVIAAATGTTIKGSGATSATTALLVQNSAGTELFKMRDDGAGFFSTYLQGTRIYTTAVGEAFPSLSFSGSSGTGIFQPSAGSNVIGFSVSGSEKARIDANGVGIGETTPTARLQVKGSGNDATTTALLVQNSDGDDMLKVTDDGKLSVLASVVGNLCATLENTSSTGFGLDIKAGVSSTNYSLQWRNYNGSGGGRMYPEGIIIGAQSTPSARLQVKGSGATSATTALLVQNSAGSDLLKVNDGGDVIVSKENLVIPSFKQIYGGSNLYGIFLQGSTAMQFTSWNKNFDFVTQNGKVFQIKNDASTIIGGGTHDTSAVLQADSTTKGFLPPRMTTTQRDAITTPAAGLMVYNTTTNKAQCYNGTTWNDLF